MKKYLLITTLATTLLSSGCASIVSHSRWPVVISSAPIGATVSIVNRNGEQVFTGPTPVSTSLKSGSGFFRRENYTLNFTKPGFDAQSVKLSTSVNGWYFGNLFIGGWLGMLIIDPATGAMYRLDQKQVQTTLTETRAMIVPEAGANGVQIVSIEQVPANLRASLVPIK